VRLGKKPSDYIRVEACHGTQICDRGRRSPEASRGAYHSHTTLYGRKEWEDVENFVSWMKRTKPGGLDETDQTTETLLPLLLGID
jgi:hypothetical protein